MLNKKIIIIIISVLLLAGITIATEPRFMVEGTSGIVAWINETGSLNITEDFICDSCINPEDVNDIDKEDIETDLNTFVDIAGDTMAGDLNMSTYNITTINSGLNFYNSTNDKIFCVYNNDTHLIISSEC